MASDLIKQVLTDQPTRRRRKLRSEPEIEFAHYPRIGPGQYLAYCRSARVYRDPQFKRWTCLLRWDVFADSGMSIVATLPQWISLGIREKPQASRRGKYLVEWVRANGAPPVRGDRVSPRVFTHRVARVEIADTDCIKSIVPYSVVRRVLSWETGAIESIRQQVTHQG